MTEIERNDVILMLRSVAQEMMLHEKYFCELDLGLGDGDHGVTVSRGEQESGRGIRGCCGSGGIWCAGYCENDREEGESTFPGREIRWEKGCRRCVYGRDDWGDVHVFETTIDMPEWRENEKDQK